MRKSDLEWPKYPGNDRQSLEDLQTQFQHVLKATLINIVWQWRDSTEWNKIGNPEVN